MVINDITGNMNKVSQEIKAMNIEKNNYIRKSHEFEEANRISSLKEE